MARRKTRRAAPEDLFIGALDDVPDQFLACRETAHSWRITSPFRLVDTAEEHGRQARGGHASYAERRLTCQRCGMVRSDAYSITTRHGHTSLGKIGSTYAAPDGYAITGVGSTAGMRDLLLGYAFDQQTNGRI